METGELFARGKDDERNEAVDSPLALSQTRKSDGMEFDYILEDEGTA
jgi:hypothetical protein